MTLTPAIEGAGPEQLQQRKALRAVLSRLYADVGKVAVQDPIASGFVSADTPNPQAIRRINPQSAAVRADATSSDARAPFLPMRVSPASWDGEPGYTSPIEAV